MKVEISTKERHILHSALIRYMVWAQEQKNFVMRQNDDFFKENDMSMNEEIEFWNDKINQVSMMISRF